MLYCHLYCNAILVVQRCMDRISHRRLYIKNVFLQISQNSQENTCARVSSLRDFITGIFSCEFSEICKTTFLTKHLWATASVFRAMSNIYDRAFLRKYRSSRPEVLLKKVFLEISLWHTWARVSFLIKLQASGTLAPWHKCFPVSSVKFLRTPFLKEHH